MSHQLTRRFLLFPLLAVTLLAGCVSDQKYNALNGKYTQLKAAYGSDQAEIVMLDGKLKVVFRDQVLFPEGGYRLTPGAQAVLAKMVPTLSGLQQTKVVVDGYTDNVQIGPELKRLGIASNLDLSSKRADGVVDYLLSQGLNQNLVSAQGFGESNPVASNDTAAGRASNRRIEVSLVGPGT
jgi:chemotaxis protein MotB